MTSVSFAQDRFQVMEQRLKEMSVEVPGLNEKVQLSISGATIQEFLRGLAESNNLNINVDPQLNARIYNNFKNEKAINVLLFLAREYNLDFRFVGSIISVVPFLAPVQVPVYQPKELRISYENSSNNLRLELSNDSLGVVAKKISEVSGKSVIAPSNLLGKQVSIFINAPFENAIEKLAYSNGLKLVRTADNVFLIQALGDNEETYIDADNKIAIRKARSQNPGSNGFQNMGGQGGGPVNVELIKGADGRRLLNVDARNASINEIVKAAAEEYGINYYLFSDVRGTTTTRLRSVEFDQLLSTILMGTDYTFKTDKNVYMIGERKLEGLRAIKVLPLQYRSLDTVEAMIPIEWKRGVEIKEFREQNTLLLAGAMPQIQEIEAFVRQIDKLVPMILIEVTMVDVRKGKSVKTGIKAGVADSVVRSGGTVFPGLDYTFGAKSINDFLGKIGSNSTFNIGRVTPNFYVKLSALEENQNVDVRSMPKLATLNGHVANLSIGSTRYYTTTTQNVMGSLNPQTVVTQNFTPVEANLSIKIKPIVSADEQVTLNIKVDISDFLGNPPANTPPPLATSKFESIIRVKNDEMVLLGGLERTEKTDSGSGVPILSRIPILKWFFSSREKGTNKIVSIVFIKPTIIYQ